MGKGSGATVAPQAAVSGSRVGAIAVVLSASILLSRVLGYLREAAIANQLGASASTDAFYAAFMIPDILNYLMAGGALTIAFVPLYTRTRAQHGEAAAERLFATVLGTLGAVAAMGTLLLWGVAEPLVRLQFGAFDAGTQALTVELTRVLLPAQVAFLMGGIVRARLMADDRFATHALAGVVYNLATIAGGLASGTPQGFAWGALTGAVLGHLALPIADLARTDSLRALVAPFSREFRAYLVLALPLMLGVSLTTVDEWYEKWFGGALATATIAYLLFARRLVQAPISIVGQAIAVAILPTLARLRSEGRSDELDATLARALRASIELGVLCGAFVLAFAAPIVELLYRHGAFGMQDAERVASVLTVMSVGVVAWIAQQVGVRAFYAREEMWRPMALGTAVALAAVPLYVAAGHAYGAEGLAGAGVLAMSANALATLVWARTRFGGPRLVPLGLALLRGAALAAPVAVLARALAPRGAGKTGAVLELGAGGAVFALLALGGVMVVGDEATRATVRRALARLRRSVR